MSFSDDLDAARDRAGLPVIHRLYCEYDRATLITIDPERAGAFLAKHGRAGSARLVTGPGRFRIKRFPLRSSTDPVWPWRVTDAARPGVFGRARTHAAAVKLVEVMHARTGEHAVISDDDDETVAYVTGRVPAYRRHINAPCSVAPILKPQPGSILDLTKLDTGAPMRLVINEPEHDVAASIVALRRLNACSCGGVGGRHRWGCERA